METAVRGTPAGDDLPGAPGRARPGEPARHEMVLYTSPADLAAQLAPRVRDALTARQPVVAVLERSCEKALRAALGPAADGVEFDDPARVHSVPAFTVAVRYARTSRRATRAGGRALVVGQCVTELPACGPGHWARLDSALNVAIAGLPITVLCPVQVDTPELAQALTTHPVVSSSTGSTANDRYRPPRDVLVDFPPPPPPDLGPPDTELTFGRRELAALRHLVGTVAGDAGVSPDRAADLVLAVNELVSNSIEHGPGTGSLRLWAGPPFVAEVSDDGGPMDVPFPGLTLPPPEGARGRGLWLASELCDVLQVWTGAGSTVVRVHVSP